MGEGNKQARLAQSVERQALNLVVGGSSPPVGDSFFSLHSPPLFERPSSEGGKKVSDAGIEPATYRV